MTGPPGYRFLPWDSEFFGVRIAQIESAGFADASRADCLQWCRDERIDCAYLFVKSGEQPLIDAAGAAGFRLVDIRVLLSARLPERARPEHPAGVLLRASRESDVEPLSVIARIAHHDTRFYVDEQFGEQRCDDLYELWITKSCRGWADHVVVAEQHGVAVGYVTCHKSEGAGRIGLVGVGADSRGLGIGQAMLREALGWFANEGIDRVTVATQSRNSAAMILYQKVGFTVEAVDCVFHKWFASASNRH